ncbi:MAG: nucleotidyltransferase [Synergistaceae bacterium]|nr:nucleotidyltransferase [Synergistaceae bacterium]
MNDSRWKHRLNSYTKALSQLEESCGLAKSRPLTKLEEQGLIQAFEFTHELAWKTLKDFLESRGASNLFGSRDTTRAAFSRDLLGDGEAWMDMIVCRNLTSYTYDEDTASRVAARILESFCGEFVRLKETMAALAEEDPL